MIISSVSKYLRLIKFSHTVFALPFALISALLALQTVQAVPLQQSWWITVFWIVLAMVGARSGAMGFNRLVDRKWDAKNPRTANRPSVTGEISVVQMTTMIIISFALLVFSAWKLNQLAFWLSPVAIFLVCFYSWCKRFTSMAHLFLGLAIGAAPIASWIAVTGEISISSLYLGASVLTWIAGFDILYALQDHEFDKKAGLNSIPVRFGVANSLRIARGLHLLTVLFWILFPTGLDLHWLYYLGVAICSALLLWEHYLVREDDLSKINVAFMNMNSIISVTLFSSVVLDLCIY